MRVMHLKSGAEGPGGKAPPGKECGSGVGIPELLQRYKSQLLYLFFGGWTTIVNVVVYGLCTRMASLSATLSTAVAWCAAVLFAYLTNRTWVFESRASTAPDILREAWSFLLCRLATGGLDLAIMYLCVERLGLPDIPIKILSNLLVVVLNYIAGKLIVFSKPK